LFGTALSEQFAECDDVPAPPVLVRCTSELEKRMQETGRYILSFIAELIVGSEFIQFYIVLSPVIVHRPVFARNHYMSLCILCVLFCI